MNSYHVIYQLSCLLQNSEAKTIKCIQFCAFINVIYTRRVSAVSDTKSLDSKLRNIDRIFSLEHEIFLVLLTRKLLTEENWGDCNLRG